VGVDGGRRLSEPTAVLLTGARGAGKTTLCLSLVGAAGGIGGVACPAILDERGEKVGFSCRCLETGREWELGRSDRILGSARVGKYTLSDEGIRRALSCLNRAITERRTPTVIDEIGPLELEMSGGFAPILPALRGAANLLVVVRQALIGRLSVYLPGHRIRVVSVTEANRDDVRGDLLQAFG
jgi:nucleoside-triphosphatase THEP1